MKRSVLHKLDRHVFEWQKGATYQGYVSEELNLVICNQAYWAIHKTLRRQLVTGINASIRRL